jgi:NAD-dependent deacetylase
MKPNIVVLTGAGISAESGIATFRDSGGLWEQYKIEDVATPDAWRRNPQLVTQFYNMRRAQAAAAQPNAAHLALVKLEEKYNVHIITQNVDDLHERAGSANVLHLHGELCKVRSTVDAKLVYNVGSKAIAIGDKCDKGSQLRPDIVWFGEAVPAMDDAIALAQKADLFMVIGTSLQVYPAAGLLHFAAEDIPKYLIDPMAVPVEGVFNLQVLPEKAGTGVPKIVEVLLNR